jgi:hypothetical protein
MRCAPFRMCVLDTCAVDITAINTSKHVHLCLSHFTLNCSSQAVQVAAGHCWRAPASLCGIQGRAHNLECACLLLMYVLYAAVCTVLLRPRSSGSCWRLLVCAVRQTCALTTHQVRVTASRTPIIPQHAMRVVGHNSSNSFGGGRGCYKWILSPQGGTLHTVFIVAAVTA